ncbi:MAG: terminase large subunit [Actinomycetota bacterium]
MSELDGFCRFCGELLTTEDGTPLAIENFQRLILADFFDGCRETVVLVGKKNGKSSLLGAIALYHLLSTPEAECMIVAASRDQAGIMLRQIQGYVRRSAPLRDRLRVVQREVRDERSGGRIRVLASDSDTLDGQIPSLALVDELARTKTEEAYGLLRDGLGPRNGQMVAISTAGDDENSPLGRLRAAAHDMDGFETDGAYKHGRRGGFAWHEWSLNSGDDINDLELLKSANPASWVDEDELRARRDSPSTQPWQLARFTAGLWVQGEESAISPKEWEACAEPGIEIPEGEKGVVIGIDLGWKWDTTAIVPIWQGGARAPRGSRMLGITGGPWGCDADGCGEIATEAAMDRFGMKVGMALCDEHKDWKPAEPGPVIVHTPAILVPPQDGTSLDAEDVFAVCVHFADRWPGPTFVLDPEAGGEQLGQRIEREIEGVKVETHSQKALPMAASSQRLAETIASKGLRHPADEALTRHVLSASARWTGPVWRFEKPKGKKLPIDAVDALCMALEVLSTRQPKRRSVYERRGLVVG